MKKHTVTPILDDGSEGPTTYYDTFGQAGDAATAALRVHPRPAYIVISESEEQ